MKPAYQRHGMLPALVSSAALALVCVSSALHGQPAATPDLDHELATLVIPPPWLADVTTDYAPTHPWKETRLHVRSLLDQHRNREAIKITYDSIVVRAAAPNDHEYGMYLYLGGEYVWALKIYQDRIDDDPKRETIAYTNLASLYVHFGRAEEAIKTLRQGLNHLPDPPWDVPSAAKLHERLGDTHASMGHLRDATDEYAEAARIYPASKQPYGRGDLPKHVQRVEGKTERLRLGRVDLVGLRDGVHRAESIGYAGDVGVELEVRQGRVTDLRLRHKEHIEQYSTTRIPAAILRQQSLNVDAITAATVTTDAIINATYNAAVKAGLKRPDR